MPDKTVDQTCYRVQIYRSYYDRWEDLTGCSASTPEGAWKLSGLNREVAAGHKFRVVKYHKIETWTVVE